MRISILKELKPYSIIELEKIFNLNELKIKSILKSLSLLNVVKCISSKSSMFEIEDLVDLENIENLFSNMNNEIYIFSYVGVITILDYCLIIYPKYVKNYEKDANNKFKDFKQIFSVIKKYQSKDQKIGHSLLSDDFNFNLLTLAFDLIKDYHENGIYTNEREIVEINGNGEVLWNKTINESVAYINNNIPIYLDLFTVNKLDDSNNFFRRLHAAIITEVCKDIKDVLSILDIECLNLSDESVESFGNSAYLIYKINQEMNNQFITSRQYILKLMKKYIEKNKIKSALEDISFVGTTSFNLVWEDVCSTVMGNCINKSIVELGLTHKDNKKCSFTIADIIEKPLWKHRESGNIHSSKGTLVPDIVIIRDNELAIYDAKYYKIILSSEKVDKQPGIGDVTKQYFYELAYKEFMKENKLKIKINAFLFPSEGNNSVNLGSVSLSMFNQSMKGEFRNIDVILLPCKKLYENYLNDICDSYLID